MGSSKTSRNLPLEVRILRFEVPNFAYITRKLSGIWIWYLGILGPKILIWHTRCSQVITICALPPSKCLFGQCGWHWICLFFKNLMVGEAHTDPRCVITVPRWLIYTSPPHFDNQSSIIWRGRWVGLSVCDCCYRGDTCFRVFQPPFSNVSFTVAWSIVHGSCAFFRVLQFFAFRISVEFIMRFDLDLSSRLTLIFRMFIFVFVFVRFGFFKSALTAYFVSVAAIFISFLFPSLLNK